MRAAILSLGLSLLVTTGYLVPSVAVAQDGFDDEFGNEFGGQQHGQAQQGQAQQGQAQQGQAAQSGHGQATPGQGSQTQAPAPQATDQETAPAAGETPPPQSRHGSALRTRQFREQNTWQGSVGGIHVVDAGSAAPGSFRLQLAASYFSAGDFLVTGDHDERVGGALSMSWTVAKYLELYGSLASWANSNDKENPQLFQVLGDTLLGAKGYYSPLPWLTVGGDLGIALLNTVGDIGLVLDSTSFGLRGNATADLRGLAKPIPLIIRFNAQYWFDNSHNLTDNVEHERYSRLTDPLPYQNETRNLLTRVERFALSIDRTDFFNLGLGLEAPFRAAQNFYISPIVEWTWNIPVNRQGYNCLFIPAAGSTSEPPAGEDGCLDKQGISSFPMNLSLAVRVLPPVEGLAAFLGVDVGLTGTSTFVRELSPNAPYDVLFGLSYAYDTTPPPPHIVTHEVTHRVQVQLPPPLTGRIKGLVVEKGTDTPVAGAIVRFTGHEDMSPIVAGQDGKFTSYAFAPGDVQMAVTDPDYHDGSCSATIPNERPAHGELDVQVRCEVMPLPRVGSLHGSVKGEDGTAVNGAQVTISGPASRALTTDASGALQAQQLPPGQYTARVEADNFLIKTVNFEVEARQTAQVDVTLVPRPRWSLVRVRRRDIQIRRQINFATDSAEILPSSDSLMAQIADVLMRNPQIHKVEIQGHTDNRGAPQHNMELSQQRADSVRTWLVDHGVEADRLEAKGYGQTRPLVPNITPANRARNRRVQFIIIEQGDSTPSGGAGGAAPAHPAAGAGTHAH